MANDFSGDPNCVALYNMDTNLAGLVVDSGPIGTNLLTNVGVVADAIDFKQGDQSGDFGSGDRLGITDVLTDDTFPFKIGKTNSKISLCYWINWNYMTSLTHYSGAIGKWAGAGTKCFVISNGPGATHLFEMWMGYNAGASYEVSSSFGTPVTTGVWYHVSCSLDGITGAYRIRIWDDTAGAFLDDDVVGTFVNAPMAYAGAWEIGRLVSFYTYGNVDEVVIWNDIKLPVDFDAVRNGTYVYTAPIVEIGGSYLGKEKALNPKLKDWTAGDPDDWTVTEVGDATSNITENPVGYARIVSNGAVAKMSNDGAVPVVGKKYKATVDVSLGDDISYTISFGGLTSAITSAAGILELEGIASSVNPLTITSEDPGDFVVSDVSFREYVPLVSGNPTDDAIYDALILYPGALDDKLLAFYQANGATADDLQDAEREFLIISGVTGTGHNQELWVEYILTLTPPAALVTYQDLWNWYWINL